MRSIGLSQRRAGSENAVRESACIREYGAMIISKAIIFSFKAFQTLAAIES
jgi:hypothetical protein